ncbi:MAG TPA: hypothetical protein VF623_01040 [Segetibacter sp.]|jgi:hypothetical protein
MIEANELRIGNLVVWNRALISPDSTLPPMQIQVSAIMPDKISYVFPNIENRVEPFEDDVAQTGVRTKMLEEIEPVMLTNEILENTGFIEKNGLLTSRHLEQNELQMKFNGTHYQRVSISALNTVVHDLPIKYFHQLQNLFFALTGEELEMKLHGQQA